MTQAKPQQMTGQQDNPDDLIAELTKLMSLEARPSADRDAPAPMPSAPPVAALPQRSTPATIRIPGVEQPIRGTAPQTAAPEPAAARQPATGEGRSNVVAANWPRQNPVAQTPAAQNLPAQNLTAQDSAPKNAAPQDIVRKDTDRHGAAPQSASAPAVESAARDSEAIPSFEFDFGFNRQRPEALPRSAMPVSPSRPTTPPKPGVPAAPTASALSPVDRDPIAELIAAELKGVIGQPEAEPVTAPQPRANVPALPHATPSEPTPEITPPANPSPAPSVAAETPQFRQTVPVTSAPAPSAPVRQAASPQAQPQARQSAQSPAPTPRLPADNDRFSTAPVFGLGNRPAGETAPVRPPADPIDEIESLIGEAVRVELGAPAPAPSIAPRPAAEAQPTARGEALVARPAVPPLSNNFTPRRTPSLRESENLRESEFGAGVGADEAVLAATAAANAGREVGAPLVATREEAPTRPVRREREARRAGGALRQFFVPVVAGVVLVAIGFGLYWALGMGHHEGTAPVLTADATPAKTIPPKPADTTPHSVVMDQLGGAAPEPSAETLVSRDQTRAPDGTTQVAAATPSADDASLANRKVRTVTVRPDGTIISSDDSVAGGTVLPVDRPNVPAVPGIAVANAKEPAAAPVSALTNAPSIDTSGVPSDDPIAQAIAGAAPDVAGNAAPMPAPAPMAQPAAAAPAADAVVVDAPVPMPRSARPEAVAMADDVMPASAVNAVVAGGAAARPLDLGTPPARSPAPAASSAGGYVAHAQLASQPSEAAAQSTAGTLQRRFGNLLNGAKLSVVRADLGAKGVYYRVIVPTSSLGDAQQLCSSIRSNGGDCVAANG